MTDSRYHLVAGTGTSRRVHHGTPRAAARAFELLREEETMGAELIDVTDSVAAALDLLRSSGEKDLVSIGVQGRWSQGWLSDYALYAALCGAASTRFPSFAPTDEDDYEIEFWGWRWGNVGLPSEDMSEELCERIAHLVLQRAPTTQSETSA